MPQESIKSAEFTKVVISDGGRKSKQSLKKGSLCVDKIRSGNNSESKYIEINCSAKDLCNNITSAIEQPNCQMNIIQQVSTEETKQSERNQQAQMEDNHAADVQEVNSLVKDVSIQSLTMD